MVDKEKITENKKKYVKRRLIIAAISVFTAIAIVCGAFFIYASDYYHALPQAQTVFSSDDGVRGEELDDGSIAYIPEKPVAGLIFYPGGKVEYTAYAPLMRACAQRGILCVLVKMPFNLAVFDINAADGIQERYPEIDKWYIGGHSLGGSMASSYIKKSGDVFDGLILLGSYSTVDLSEKNIGVLSVYGSEDKVLNKDKYDECKANLPTSFREKIIKGGCHAFFGMYGNQEGDGKPTISNERQIQITADIICDFVN
jgi:dienelactone hydrolase